MESLVNIVILIIVIASVVFRVKRVAKDMQKKGQFGARANQPANPASQSAIDAVARTVVVPPQFQAALPQIGFNSKDLNKRVTVYGPGAQLGTDEVSILLNVSPEQAQNYLDQLAGQGRAVQTTGASGKVRYKLV